MSDRLPVDVEEAALPEDVEVWLKISARQAFEQGLSLCGLALVVGADGIDGSNKADADVALHTGLVGLLMRIRAMLSVCKDV